MYLVIVSVLLLGRVGRPVQALRLLLSKRHPCPAMVLLLVLLAVARHGSAAAHHAAHIRPAQRSRRHQTGRQHVGRVLS